MVRLLDSAVVQSEIRGKFHFCDGGWLGVLFLFRLSKSFHPLNLLERSF